MDEQGMAGGVSRRNFIKGVIAAGATVSASAYLFRTTILGQNESSLPGSVERLITIDVNGQQRRVDVLKHETLATTLRYKLGMTGTKLGCDRARMRRLHRADRRCAALQLLDPHASSARQEDRHGRGPGIARRQAVRGATGGRRLAGLPVRVLHVRLHDDAPPGS